MRRMATRQSQPKAFLFVNWWMNFTIKELESLSGIKAHTIRIWEQRYNFLQPSRTQTNIRRYNNDELKTLLTVALLNKYGHKISRIDEMTPEQRDEAALNLQPSDAKDEYITNGLIGYMIDLKGLELEKLLTEQVHNQGMEKIIAGVVFRFLERVGILWQTNRLRPVQEHLVSAIIRQKMICGIDSLPLPTTAAPLFVLFLPEAEHHELGLLYVYYLLRKRGLPVIYLGANVPLRDMEHILPQRKPQYIYTHLTSFSGHAKFQRFMERLSDDAVHTQSTVLLSGYVAQLFKKPQWPNVVLLQSLSSVQSYIQAIA